MIWPYVIPPSQPERRFGDVLVVPIAQGVEVPNTPDMLALLSTCQEAAVKLKV